MMARRVRAENTSRSLQRRFWRAYRLLLIYGAVAALVVLAKGPGEGLCCDVGIAALLVGYAAVQEEVVTCLCGGGRFRLVTQSGRLVELVLYGAMTGDHPGSAVWLVVEPDT